MHSSIMRNGRSLTVCRGGGVLPAGGVSPCPGGFSLPVGSPCPGGGGVLPAQRVSLPRGLPARGDLLAHSGFSLPRGILPARWFSPPKGGSPGVSLPGGLPARGVLPTKGFSLPGGLPTGGSPHPGGSSCWKPPVDRITDTSKT